MFETLRKMIVPIIAIVLFFFVAMIVLQWGMGMSSRQSYENTNVAAVINGEEIGWDVYNRLYNGLLQSESSKSEEDLPESKIQEIQQNAWNQLLHDRLIRQEVSKMNMIVTDEELYSYLRMTPPPELQSIPDFQTDGKFDYQKYLNMMVNPQAAPFWASVESAVKSDILKFKLQELIVQAAHVTEEEIRQAFLEDKERVKVGMINVDYGRFSKPPPTNTDEELLAYYEEHKEKYSLKERASLNAAVLEKKPAPYDWEVSYNKTKAIYDSIAAGNDFAEMAKVYSQDGSAADGGDLDWFPQGQMVAEFDKKVFNMKVGEFSEPVRTQFGWHIIKLLDRKEVLEVPRGETKAVPILKVHASHILIKAEVSQQTLDDLYNRLEEFDNLAKDIGFMEAAKQLKINVRPTGLFRRGTKNIAVIGNNPYAGLFAFDNEEGTISDIIENNYSFCVAEVSEKRPAGPANFEEAKDRVGLDLLKYKVATSCRDTANAIFADIQGGMSWKKAAKKHGDEYVEPDPFTRGGFSKEIRRDPIAIGAAFSLTEPGQTVGPVDFDQGAVMMKLIERTSPDLDEFNAKRDSISNGLVFLKQQEMYGRWFQGLVKRSDIVNNVQKTLEASKEFL